MKKYTTATNYAMSSGINFDVSSLVSLTPSVAMPDVSECDDDGIWISTPTDTNITIDNAMPCYNGSTPGTYWIHIYTALCEWYIL